MKRYSIAYLIITLLSLTTTLKASDSPAAIKGIINAEQFNFENNKKLLLIGEWDFYPNEFTPPDQESPNKAYLIQVPQLWSHSEISEIESSLAFGTYRLRVKVPSSEQILALRLSRIESAYKLFFNDSLIAQSGVPASSQNNAAPHKVNNFVHLPVKGQNFTLTLHISNFNHKKAGILSLPELGRPETIARRIWQARGIEMLLMGALLIMAFYHISLFFLRRDDISPLYFALFLIMVQLQMSINGEMLFMELFKNISWELLMKLDFISNFLTIAFFFLFFESLKPFMYKRFVVIIFVGIPVAFSVITLFTKAIIFTRFLTVFQLTAFATLLYIITTLIICIAKKEKDAWFPLLGTLLILTTGINDVLNERMVVNTFNMLPVGVVGFILLQSHILNSGFKKMVDDTHEINKFTQKLDELKSKFLSKSSFDFNYPLEVISKELSAGYAVIYEPGDADIKPIAIFPKQFENKPPSSNSQKIATECFVSQQVELKTKTNSPNGRPCLGFPFVVNNTVEYILYIERAAEFQEEEIKILDLLSEQILGLAQNYKLFHELKDLSSRLEEIIEERTKEVRSQRENLEQQRDKIEQQAGKLNQIYEEIHQKNKAIKADILYAQKIHSALFKSWKKMDSILPAHFIFFKPKEIIGGDFYWGEKIGSESIFCAADCTGHGVPGALMSIIGQNLLNSAVYELQLTEPSEILNRMQVVIRKVLSQYKGSKSKDGMDMSMINYNSDTKTLKFSAARNSGYIVRKAEIIELSSDRMSIGGIAHARIDKSVRFSQTEIKVEENDMLYLMTDGYIDQIGGKNHRKFMRKRMRELFISLSDMELTQQKKQFAQILDKWRGEITQMDDVLVVGIRF